MTFKKSISIISIICITLAPLFSFAQNEIITELNTITESDTSNYTNDDEFKTNLPFGDGEAVSGLNLPRLDTEGFQGDEPIMLIKDIIYKIIELLPFIIFVMLLLGCFHMIVSIKDGEGKKGMKIIKQVILGTILFIISIYVLNIVSIYITGSPVLRLDQIFHTYIGGNDTRL